jgi:TRAP-type C4-dicarboxylate transport system substrate-binding protein
MATAMATDLFDRLSGDDETAVDLLDAMIEAAQRGIQMGEALTLKAVREFVTEGVEVAGAKIEEGEEEPSESEPDAGSSEPA